MNAQDEYLEIGVAGSGDYYAALYKKYEDGNQTMLVDLLELELTVYIKEGVNCTMLALPADGGSCWGASVTIPRDYLPAKKITKYNMYLTNSDKVQAVKTGDNPAKDNLDNFETAAIDTGEKSALWKSALGDNDFMTTYVTKVFFFTTSYFILESKKKRVCF